MSGSFSKIKIDIEENTIKQIDLEKNNHKLTTEEYLKSKKNLQDSLCELSSTVDFFKVENENLRLTNGQIIKNKEVEMVD